MNWDLRTSEEIAFDRRLAEFCDEMTRWDQWVQDEGPPVEPTDQFLHPVLGPVTVKCANPTCPDSKITPVYQTDDGVCVGCGNRQPLDGCIQLVNIDNL